MGGHSLLAVKLLNLVQQELGQQLALRSLFQNPTIAQLAQHIGNREIQESNPDLVTIQPLGDATPLFCISGSNGHGKQLMMISHLQSSIEFVRMLLMSL